MATALPDVVVGRHSELAEFRSAVTAVVAGRGRAILVEGEPGIGKSTVVRAATNEAVELGCELYWATCDQLSQAFALVPLLDALLVRESASDPRRSAIARLMRGDPAETSGSDVVTAASERLLSLVDELCSAGPVVLVVDDLQWADPATVRVWNRLARSVEQVALLLVGILRPVPRREDLVALRRLVGTKGRMALTSLGEPEVVRLVAAVVGGPPGDRLVRLASGAAGNPLYLTELCAGLVHSGRLSRDGARVELAERPEQTRAPRPIPLSVAVAGRLGFLSEPTREVLYTAALLGSDFSVPELAVVSGHRVPDLIPALDEAIAAGVLHDDTQGLAFRHPLIRAALYDGVSSAVRAAWHAEAGKALAAAGARVDRVARQLLAALDDPRGTAALDGGWLAGWLLTSAEQLVGRAPQAAVPLLRAAISGRANQLKQPKQAKLTGWLADALYRTGDTSAAERVAAEALTGRPGPDELVDLHWTLAQCLAAQGRSVECVQTLETALATPGLDRRHQARLRVLVARAYRNDGKVDAARTRAHEAHDEAMAVGDHSTVGWSLAMLSLVHVMHGEHAEALPLFEKALAVAARDPALADLGLLLRINRAGALGKLDKYAEAIADAKEARQLADEAGNVLRLSQAQSVLGELQFDAGRWDDALADVAHVEAPVGHSRNAVVECVAHGIAATIRLHRGDSSAAGEIQAAEPYAALIKDRVVGTLALARSLQHEQSGSPEEALRVLASALAAEQEPAETEDLLADAVRLAVGAGEWEQARRAATRADELARTSDVPRRRALALHCRGLLDGSAEELALAADGYQLAGRPLPRAQALEAAGVVLAEAGNPLAARRHFTNAFAGYSALGATWDLARLQARFRAYGIRRGPQSPHRRARTGWESLTHTELRIADLVARGLSNPAIAAELFLSRRTVQTHVSHILAKLGLTSRVDIARLANQRQA